MLPASTSRATKVPKRTYVLMQVVGGGESRTTEYAVLSLNAKTIHHFLKRGALASALQTLDESFGHVSFHGNYCEWLTWSEKLEELLGGKESVVLDRRPCGESVAMDACYVDVWHDGDIYFTGYEKHSEGQPTWQAGPVPRDLLEEVKRHLAPAEVNQ
jgi:hypothetical protein